MFMKSFKALLSVCFTVLCLCMPVLASAQNIATKGKVVDGSGEAVMGAYVLEKGTQNGVVTDIDGNFAITVKKGATIAVSFIGYTTSEVVVENNNFIDVILNEDTETLEELVVVGYATGKKRSISGAVERMTADDLNVGFIATPMDAIRAKVSGLTITSNGGDPNGTPTVRLRGTSSLSGETGPLFIIDGMFSDVATFNSLNAADIEEVTVLKDASETAQYGSRGASGVIVVRTTRGAAGQARVDYRGQIGIANAYKLPGHMQAADWKYWNNELQAHGTDHGSETDFYGLILNKTALQHNHNLSIAFGNQKANMRASLGVNQRQGQIKGSGNILYNFRVNSTVNFIKDKLTLEVGAMGSRRDSDNKGGQNLFKCGVQFNPTFPDHRNPETGLWDSDPSAQEVSNPLGQLEEISKGENTRLSANARLSWKIIDGLTLSAYGAWNWSDNISKSYTPNDVQAGYSTSGSASISNSKSQDLMGNIQLTYVKDIKKHSLNFLLLAEAMKAESFSFNARSTGYDTNYFLYNNLSAGANVGYGYVGSSASDNALLSYMGRFNYMYDNRYVVTLNLRADGSSKLGANNKWGFFPSASAAWLIHNEEFMKNTPVSNLKLRVGYGLTGNQNGIAAYNSLPLMSPSKITMVDGVAHVAYAYSRNNNPDLKWETKYTLNAGVDFGFFKNRLRGSIDYYQSTTKDLLYTYTVPVPPFLNSRLLANVGQMSNKGVELSVGGDIIATKTWGLTVSLQGAYQESNIDSISGMYGDQELKPAQPVALASIVNAGGMTTDTSVIFMEEGKPYGFHKIYLQKKNEDGSWALLEDSKNPGHYKYDLVDVDGDGRVRASSTSGDRVDCGQAVPKFTMGASIQLRYKDFDFTTQLSGAFGHKIYNSTSAVYYNMGNFPAYNVYKDAPNRMIYDIRISDYWLEPGDYVNIDYMSLGWNAPVRKWNTVFSKLRLAISCNNVVTFTKYTGMTPLMNIASPSGALDDRGVYPVSRTYMFSLQFGF